MFGPLVVVISQIVHIFLIEKSVSDPEEKRIVQNSIHRIKIPSDVWHTAIKHLTHSIDSCGLLELAPEPFRDLWYSIDPQSINIVLLH